GADEAELAERSAQCPGSGRDRRPDPDGGDAGRLGIEAESRAMAEGRLAAALNHAASWVKSNPKDAIALQDGPHVDLADTGRSAAAKRKSLSIVRPRGSETNCARRKAPHLIRLFRGSWCCSLAAVIDDG